METKSRFEVLKELNDKKEGLFREKAKLDADMLSWDKTLKMKKRELEDLEADINALKTEMPERKILIDALIKSTDASIESLHQINKL